jgi:hypothetical protein
MFTLVFIFWGMAGFIVAALFCFSARKRASQYAEVDFDALHAASACLSARRGAVADDTRATRDKEPTCDEKAKWREMKVLWMQCYAKCQERALARQREMCCWARTLALCAALCLVGVLLEGAFGQSISISNILADDRHPHSVAASSQASQLHPPQSTFP